MLTLKWTRNPDGDYVCGRWKLRRVQNEMVRSRHYWLVSDSKRTCGRSVLDVTTYDALADAKQAVADYVRDLAVSA